MDFASLACVIRGGDVIKIQLACDFPTSLFLMVVVVGRQGLRCTLWTWHALALLEQGIYHQETRWSREERLRTCSTALPSTPYWDGEDVGAQGRQVTQAGDWLCHRRLSWA